MFALLFFAIPLFLMLLPLLCSNARSLFAVVAGVGGLLAFLAIDHRIAADAPDFDLGFGGAIGIAVLQISTLGFGSMSIARAFGLALQHHQGWSRARALGMDGLGVLAIMAVGCSVWWMALQSQTEEVATCSAAFEVNLAGKSFDVPNDKAVQIYAGASVRDEARYYLFSAKHQRALCAMTQSGEVAFEATALSIGGHRDRLNARCAEAHSSWEKAFCGSDGATLYVTRFYVFTPEMKRGGFGRSTLAFEAFAQSRVTDPWKSDAFQNLGDVTRYPDEFLVLRLSGYRDVIAKCSAFRDILNCDVDERMPGGLLLSWSFSAPAIAAGSAFPKARDAVLRLYGALEK